MRPFYRRATGKCGPAHLRFDRLFQRSLLTTAGAAALLLGSGTSVWAQSIWQGTASSVYNTDANWDNGTAPTGAGQSAIFAGTGPAALTLSSNVAPDSWIFTSDSQSFSFTNGTATLSSGLTDNAVGKTIFLNSTIAGTGGITMNDATGTLLLDQNNTYSGTTTINAGTVQVGNGAAIGALGSAAVVNNGSLVFIASGNRTVLNQISGSGIVTVRGNGTYSFTAANTYSGGTTVSGRALLTAASDANLGSTSGSLTLDNGKFSFNGNFDLARNVVLGSGGGTFSNTGSISGVISGSGGLAKGGGVLTLTGTNTYTGATSIASSFLVLSGTGSIASSALTLQAATALDISATTAGSTIKSLNGVSSSQVILGAQTLTIANASDNFAGVISGTGGLLLAGGTQTLTGANTYSGGTTFAGGTLNAGSMGALATSGTLSFTGGTLQFSAANTTDYSSRFSTAASQAYSLDTNGQSVLLATALTSSGGSLTKLGAGTLTLTAANTYTGATTISAGTLALSGAGSIATSSGVAISNGGALDISATASGASVMALSGAGTVTLGNQNLIISAGTGQNFSGGIGGSGALTLSNGTQTLSGANGYGGGTTINSGTTLTAGNASALGSGAVTNNGTLAFAGANGTVANAITGGDVTVANVGTGNTLTLSGANSVNTFTVSDDSKVSFANTMHVSNLNGVYATGTTGVIDVASGGSIISTGVGVRADNALTLTNSGTIDGSTQIGVLQFGVATGSSIVNNSGATITGQTGVQANSTNVTVTNSGSIAGTLLPGVNIVSGGTVTNNVGAIISGGTNSISGFAVSVQNGSNDLIDNSGTLTGGAAGAIYLATFQNATINLNAGSTTTGAVKVDTGAFTETVAGTLNGTFDATAASGSDTLSVASTGVINGGTTGINTSRALTLTSRGHITGSTNAILATGSATADVSLLAGSVTSGSIVLGSGADTVQLYNGQGTSNGGTLAQASFGNIDLGAGANTLVLRGLGNGTTANGANGIIDISTVSSTGGTFALTKLDAGSRWILTGTAAYTGTTTIGAGTLQVGNGGTSGTLGSGNVTDNGSLAFDRSDATSYAGVISGTGQVYQIGHGTLTLSGNNTYGGTTSIQDVGTLKAGAVNAFSPNSSLSIDYTGGTVDLAGFNQTVGILTNFSLTGSATITNSGVAATLSTGNTNGSATYSGVIQDGAGALALSKVGTGTQTLSGVNTYTGATMIGGGTLALSGAGSIANSASVTDNAGFSIAAASGPVTVNQLTGTGTVLLGANTLTANNALDGTLSGVISGSGGFIKTGAGTLTLSAASTYTGATTISAGTLALSGPGAIASSSAVTDNAALDIQTAAGAVTLNQLTGTGAVTLGANSLTAVNASDGTLSGVIAGTGGFAKAGSGTLTLSAANSYSGQTQIAAGSLALTGAGSIASSSGLADNGTFDISAITPGSTTIKALTGNGVVALGAKRLVVSAGTGSFGGSFTGSGTLEVSGGTTTITGSEANNFQVDSGATLQVGSGGTSGAITGNVTDNGTLVFNRSDSVTVPGIISGTGALNQAGTGTTILTGANTYSGTTSIAGGTLQVGNGGTGGTLGSNSGAIGDNGILAFNRSDVVTLSNVVSGTGSVTQSGSGTLILTGANTYSGATMITAGTLQVGAGGTTGSLGAGAVTDNGTLAFNRSDTITVSNAISGTGGLTQAGTGTLIYDGAGTFTGTTRISSGTLEVGDAASPNAKLGGPVSVASGATLMGHGIINGAVTVASGGTVRPGGSIGTLTVNSNVTLAAGSTFVEEVSPTVADKLVVNGTTSLAGNLQIVQDAGTYTAGTDFQIISANAVTGTFAGVSGNTFAGLNSIIRYSAKSVDLILSSTAPALPQYAFATYGTTANQIAAGTALAAASPTGALYTTVGGIVTSNAAAGAAALGLLAGDIHASLRSAAVEDSRMVRDTVLARMDQDPGHRGVWITGLGGYGGIASDGNAASLHHVNGGVLAGFDMPVMAGLKLGVEGGYTSNDASTSGHLSAASGHQGHVGGYATLVEDLVQFNIGGDYGFGSVSTARSVLGETERAAQDQQTGQVFARLGYRVSLDAITLNPYLGIAYIQASDGAFAETGGNAILSGAAASNSQTYSTLGVRAGMSGWAYDTFSITPLLDVAWQHGFEQMRPGQQLNLSTAGQSFLSYGVPLSRDAAAVQAGLDIADGGPVSVSVAYDGSFSSRVQNNGIRANLNWRF